MCVIHCRIRYAAQVWTDSVAGTKKSESLLTQPQRCTALGVARCYRTVSDMAALVLASMSPARLQAFVCKIIAELYRGV